VKYFCEKGEIDAALEIFNELEDPDLTKKAGAESISKYAAAIFLIKALMESNNYNKAVEVYEALPLLNVGGITLKQMACLEIAYCINQADPQALSQERMALVKDFSARRAEIEAERQKDVLVRAIGGRALKGSSLPQFDGSSFYLEDTPIPCPA
jgi:hypothetical protein